MNAGEATKRRLLDAATAEFATYGIAGARVDRISATARANKAQLYAYFGNKEGLFDAVFGEHLDMIVNTVPLDAKDLPGYATGLYDAYLVHPELVRLATWSRLERVPAGDLITNMEDHDALKLRSIADAQRDGHINPALAPTDVLSLVTAMSMAWSPASVIIAAARDDADAEHERRKSALAETVRRAFAP
ncbi:TetR family transcriptional regulator [Streptomyces sp. AK02-01A]|uniref:TetR family transcriptional regulator n=1 Tax=Streptomyces sp. AK02-01A TaxID=3028648 RepID=UPI0029AE456F|nr:TetR family transcriptional regulator [Streptomyces sp. AK02-01A]MDX3850792.1 TetR family transcriptional regulator [Streptomyces sp. AK02-01A]